MTLEERLERMKQQAAQQPQDGLEATLSRMKQQAAQQTAGPAAPAAPERPQSIMLERERRMEPVTPPAALPVKLNAGDEDLEARRKALQDRLVKAGNMAAAYEYAGNMTAEAEAAGREEDAIRAQLRRIEAEQTRRKDAAFYAGLDEKTARLESVKDAPDFEHNVTAAKLSAQDVPRGARYEKLRRAWAYIKGGRGATANKTSQLTDEEKDVLRYYMGAGDYDSAAAYLDAKERELNRRANEGFDEKNEQWAKAHPVYGAAANAASWPFAATAYAANAAQAIKNKVTGEYEPADVNSNDFLGARFGAATSKGVSEAARQFGKEQFGNGSLEPGEDPVGDAVGNVFSFLTQTTLSVGQNATQVALLGPASLYAMGLSAAGSATTDALQRGATPEQAFAIGTANGMIEVLTEKAPLDHLLEISRKSGRGPVKELVVDILNQMSGEFTEEMVSEIADNVVDTVVMGEQSEFRQYMRELTAQGMTEDEAERQALLRFYVANVLMSGLGGAVSGGMMGAGATFDRAFETAGYYVDRLKDGQQGKRTDAAIDNAYQAMKENGPFSRQAAGAMDRANAQLDERRARDALDWLIEDGRRAREAREAAEKAQNETRGEGSIPARPGAEASNVAQEASTEGQNNTAPEAGTEKKASRARSEMRCPNCRRWMYLHP